jgi:hypothetical protein
LFLARRGGILALACLAALVAAACASTAHGTSTGSGGSPSGGSGPGGTGGAGGVGTDPGGSSGGGGGGSSTAGDPGTYWVQQTSGAKHGLARFGYGGVWDQNPIAAPGQFVFAQDDNDPATGFPAIAVPYGVIGQGAIDTVLKLRTANGCWKTAMMQDTVNYDFHVVCDEGKTGFFYFRLRPDRDGSGKITGLTSTASYSVLGNWVASNYNLAEVVDGAGNHRLVVTVTKDRAVGSDVEMDFYVGQSTIAAGVAPSSPSDWVGLDGASPDPTFVGTMHALGDQSAYVVDSYVAQHSTSRKVDLFFSQGNHGVGGDHLIVELAPVTGTGAWTARDLVSGGSAPPAGGYLSSYSNAAGLGSYAVADAHDAVWWIWDDGAETRISRLNGDGTVDWRPLPGLGVRMAWNSFRSLAIASDGAVGVIDIPGDTLDAPIRGRIYRGGAWSSWIDMGHLNNTYNYFSNPFQGLARVGGQEWFGLMSCFLPSDPDRSSESTVAALSFAAAP